MLLLSMSPSELYKNLTLDEKKIDIERRKVEPKVVKKFKKTVKFPALELVKYTIPASRNSYILYFYAENRLVAEKPVFDVFAVLPIKDDRVIIKWGLSPYQHNSSGPFIVTPKVDLYSNHVFQRYNERILKNPALSIDEVICRYFRKNTQFLLMKLNEDIKRDYQEYGETAYGMKVRDGICLGHVVVDGYFDEDSQTEKVDAIGCICCPFIDHNTLEESQNDAIEKENIRYLDEIFEGLKNNTKR